MAEEKHHIKAASLYKLRGSKRWGKLSAYSPENTGTPLKLKLENRCGSTAKQNFIQIL